MDQILVDAGSRLSQLRSAVKRRVPEGLVLYRRVTVVLAVLVVLLVAVLAVKTTSSDCAVAGAPKQECSSVACLQQAANSLSWMNASVQPCSNFYQHVCGSFGVRNPRGQRYKYGVKEKLKEYNQLRLQDLLQKSSYGAGTAFNKTATLFQSCMNVYDDSYPVQQLVELINSMGGLDLFGSWSPERYDLQSTLTKLLGTLKIGPIFTVTLTYERKLLMYPSITGHYSWKRRFLLGEPPTFSADSASNSTEHERALRRNVRTILQTLPINNTVCNGSRCLDQMVDDILHVETQLDELTMEAPLEIRVSQLNKTMDEIDWTKLLDRLYGSRYVTDNSTVLIFGMPSFEKINGIIKKTPSEKMQNFLMWCIIRDSLPMLGSRFISFYNQIEASDFTRGIGVKPRSEYCMNTVRLSMPQVTSTLFLHAHVGLDSRDAAAVLFNNTMEVLLQYSSLFNASLLSRYRSTAVHFGRANSLADTTSLDTFYRLLELNSSTHYFIAIRAVREFRTAKLRQELMEDPAGAVLAQESDVSHDFVSLIYRPLSHTLLIPFGALQSPWFNAQLPTSINTAALGSMILQTFFRKLAYSESQASLVKTNHSITAFNRYQVCVNESFSKLEVNSSGKNIQFAGMTVSTRSNEALSDHFALKASWRLFNRTTSRSTSPLGISHLSPQQQFFTAFAQARCEGGYLRPIASRESHPIEDVINNLMYNDDAFKQAFKCHPAPQTYADEHQCELT